MTSEVPAIRAAVAALPAYVPGGRAPGASAWKLSSNENPTAPSAETLKILADALAEMNRYPDMYATELSAAIADRLGVSPDSVACANGSVAALAHVLAVFCERGSEVVYAWRSFEAYPIAVGISGAESVRVPVLPDGRHDLAAMAEAITERTRLVILCSPNNPTGPAMTEAEVREFLAAVPASVPILLDEAYLEYVTRPDAVDGVRLLPEFPNLIVLRTFSKAYGLAGLRVGYAVADPRIAAAIRAVSTPFGVSSLAQAAALNALKAREALMEPVRATSAERDRVLAALREQGWDVPDADGNFVWLGVGDEATELAAAARDAGLILRGFAGDGVRVTIAEPEANDAFLAFAKDWREKH